MTTSTVPIQEMDSITFEESNTAKKATAPPPSGSRNIHVEPFSISIATESNLFGLDSMIVSGGNIDGSSRGIVGTVTFFNKSAMVWIGWGDFEEQESNVDDTDRCNNSNYALELNGTGIPVMGPMVVAMPRSKYAGSHDEAPCSQLISSSNDEEMMLGFQMASRLTKKVGWPVFVSSSLESNDASMNKVEGMEGGFGDSSVSYAAALAEKKVGQIILKRKVELEIE